MLPTRRPFRLLIPLLLLLVPAFAAAQSKELHWRSLDVKARLDSQGALHVVERQAMVFTGDWNGAEAAGAAGSSVPIESLP
jgi:hypothetical protein